jgi:hypothetical protein
MFQSARLKENKVEAKNAHREGPRVGIYRSLLPRVSPLPAGEFL